MRTNATLTEVRGAAPVDGHGDVADAALGELRWSGSRAAYIKRERRSISKNDVRVTVHVDVLIVRGQLPIEVVPGEPLAGNTILVADSRTPASVKRFRVVGVDARAAGTSVDSIRLELADEREV